MANKKTKARLEVLKTEIAVCTEIVNDDELSYNEVPSLKGVYLKKLNKAKEEYLELLREVLVPNQTYLMDMENSILPFDEENNIVPFLQKNMVYGRYESEHEDYLFDINTPFALNQYYGGGQTMEDNRAEIIECLYVSQWTFLVDDEGNTIINGRPYDIERYLVSYSENDTINVVCNKNIFDTDLIMNISLSSL
jgi:hypothetical protein